MTQDKESLNKLRGELGTSMLEEAQKSVTGGRSSLVLLLRVALVTVFMYLVFFSHMVMGTEGLIIVSVLFIAGILVPGWIVRRYRQKGDGPAES